MVLEIDQILQVLRLKGDHVPSIVMTIDRRIVEQFIICPISRMTCALVVDNINGVILLIITMAINDHLPNITKA